MGRPRSIGLGAGWPRRLSRTGEWRLALIETSKGRLEPSAKRELRTSHRDQTQDERLDRSKRQGGEIRHASQMCRCDTESVVDAQVAAIAALIGVLGGMAGVLTGTAFAEYWASKREARAEQRVADRARADRLREDRLEAVDQTRRALVARLRYLSAKANGDPSGAAVEIGLDTYPRLDESLVNSADGRRLYIEICVDLARRTAGSGLSPADNDLIGMVTSALQTIFEEQRQRALRDEELLHVAEAEVYGLTPQQMAAYKVLAWVVRAMDIPAQASGASTGDK